MSIIIVGVSTLPVCDIFIVLRSKFTITLFTIERVNHNIIIYSYTTSVTIIMTD